MAAFTIQQHDNSRGPITLTPIYVCRLTVLKPHKLLRVWVYVEHVVLTGIVEILLQKADRLDGRGGSQISEKIENADMTARTNLRARYDFELLDLAKGIAAPPEREYFLSLSGTNAADRFDEPTLIVEYE